MKKINDNIIKEMIVYYNWRPSTIKSYKITLNTYSKINNMPLKELIKEAEQEEEIIRKVNKRKIKKRIMNYILIRKKENKKESSIKQEVSQIKKMYKHYDIDLPDLPRLKKTNKYETYKQIPTREQIKDILLNTTIKQKAIITFLASSGLRRSDACKLKIKDFMESIQIYTTTNNIINVIYEIENKNEIIIPTWNIISKKTNINHITFSSDESTRIICKYLKQRLINEELNMDSSLFNYKPQTLTIMFQRLNDKLKLGTVNNTRFFHPHVLRKYFATTLYNEGVDFLSVDFLLGHTLTPIQSAYYKANPQKLKELYISNMENLTFLTSTKHEINDEQLNELEELRLYKLETSKRLDELEGLIKKFLE